MKTPEKPPSVPKDAEWSKNDNEWVLAECDPEGRRHGLVTYWRPDGTVVSKSRYEQGALHGDYQRYHPSGDVSRQGAFVHGVWQGTDVQWRTDKPTTEVFPLKNPAIWRFEMDIDHKLITATRCFNRQGRRVTARAELLPTRPPSVPDQANFDSGPPHWFWGATDLEDKKHGLWRYWSQAGDLILECQYDHGSERWRQAYANVHQAEAEVALRGGRLEEALQAGRRWWSAAKDGGQDSEAPPAGHLLLKILDAMDAGAGKIPREEKLSVAQAIRAFGKDLGPYSRHKQPAFRALQKALDTLARDLLSEGSSPKEWEQALGYANESIGCLPMDAPAEVRLTKVRLLQKLGRGTETFRLLRDLLRSCPDPKDFVDLTQAPEFLKWQAAAATWTPPAYLKASASPSRVVDYDWNETDLRWVYTLPQGLDVKTLPWAHWPDAAIGGLTIATVEWIVFRLMGLHADPTPADALAAAWCAVIDPRSCQSLELSVKEWTGPVRGPLFSGITQLHEALFECPDAGTKPLHCPVVAAGLVNHIAGESWDAFLAWREQIVARLNRIYKKTGAKVKPKIVLPPQAFDPTIEFDADQAARLCREFLKNATSRDNPFLTVGK